MRFQFPFQKIVDLKSNEKTQAEWLLSSAMVQLHEEERNLSELQELKDQVQDQMFHSSDSVLSASDLQSIQTYIHYLDSQISFKKQNVVQAKHDVEDKQQHLQVRMKDEKVWTKAKEKAYKQYQVLVQKQEQDQLDDMASVRFISKNFS